MNVSLSDEKDQPIILMHMENIKWIIRYPLIILVLIIYHGIPCISQQLYYPEKGDWEQKDPASLGLDASKLEEAVDFAKECLMDNRFGKSRKKACLCGALGRSILLFCS